MADYGIRRYRLGKARLSRALLQGFELVENSLRTQARTGSASAFLPGLDAGSGKRGQRSRKSKRPRQAERNSQNRHFEARAIKRICTNGAIRPVFCGKCAGERCFRTAC